MIRVLRVFLLQVRAIAENVLCDIERGRSTPDLSVKTVLHQARQIARVIEVSVRKDNIRRIRKLNGQRIPVHIAQLAAALEEAAVDHHAAVLRGSKKILGAGDLSGRAEELKCKHSN